MVAGWPEHTKRMALEMASVKLYHDGGHQAKSAVGVIAKLSVASPGGGGRVEKGAGL